MKVLGSVGATAEQLALLAATADDVIIYGAAGSGKTTTALMRLRALTAYWLSRRERLGLVPKVRVLVLTYNRTLAGYIEQLAREQLPNSDNLEIFVGTFAKWARGLHGPINIYDRGPEAELPQLIIPLSDKASYREFLLEESVYVMERFHPDNLEAYETARRDGRGTSPRIERPMRQRLIAEVIRPYQERLRSAGLVDWNELSVTSLTASPEQLWDIAIIDEAQDFTANQLRAVVAHLTELHSLTCVLDSMQRIYHRYFGWSEVGISGSGRTFRLKANHRNTREIASFARPILVGLPSDSDLGAMPNFETCTRTGPKPIVLKGLYSRQLDFVIANLLPTFGEGTETIAFLQPRGGGYFDVIRNRLRGLGIRWDELSQRSKWPVNDNYIALSTMHSAKGLEFDHVIVLGLNQEVTPHGEEDGDAQFGAMQRLLAMSVGRARKTFTLGYKPGAESSLVSKLDPATYTEISV